MGYYGDDHQAGYAYNCAAIFIHGEYANLNLINLCDIKNPDTIKEYVKNRLSNILN